MSQRLASVRRTFLAGWAGLPQGRGPGPAPEPPPTGLQGFLKRKRGLAALGKSLENSLLLANRKTMAYRSALQAEDSAPPAPAKLLLISLLGQAVSGQRLPSGLGGPQEEAGAGSDEVGSR